MNSILSVMYFCILSGFMVYLLKKLLDLFTKKCKIYLYDLEGNKSFWGCVKYVRSRKIYRVYGTTGDSSDKFVGEVQIQSDGNAWIRCWKNGYSPDELSFNLGYVTSEGKIFTPDGQLMGQVGQAPDVLDVNGITSWLDLFLRRHADVFPVTQQTPIAHCIETGRLHRCRTGEFSMLARAAGFILLYLKEGYLKPQEEEQTTQIYAWGDTALPATMVFMFLYGMVYWITPHYIMFPFLGERISFLIAMFLTFLLVWVFLRELKIEMLLEGKAVSAWLTLLNCNIGLARCNWFAKVFAFAGLCISIFAYGGDFAPLMLVILIGIIMCERTYPRKVWDVQTRFAFIPDSTTISPEDEGEIIRNYNWTLDSPSKESISASLVLHFKESEINELRAKNPFRQGNDFYNHVEHMFEEKLDVHHLTIINRYIAELSNQYRLTMLETIQFILDFVQKPNIDYAYDEDSTSFVEYVRYPDETLFDKVGDCDCKAMLAASLFHNAGIRVIYLTSNDHAAVAVQCQPEWFGDWSNPYVEQGLKRYEGNYYYFCETTGDGFRVGDINGDINDFTYCKLLDI